MKKATATSHGSSWRGAPPAAEESSVALTRAVLSFSELRLAGGSGAALARLPGSGAHPALERLASGERVRECAAIDILELPAHRHPMGDAARTDAAARGELAQVMRGRFPLDG